VTRVPKFKLVEKLEKKKKSIYLYVVEGAIEYEWKMLGHSL